MFKATARSPDEAADEAQSQEGFLTCEIALVPKQWTCIESTEHCLVLGEDLLSQIMPTAARTLNKRWNNRCTACGKRYEDLNFV